MSVFDGEMEFRSVYMVDFPEKIIPKPPRPKPDDDDCLIVGVGRDALTAREATPPRRVPDLMCPLTLEYYKKEVKRIAEDHPKLAKMYMAKDIDPVPIDHQIQDMKRTEYLVKFCPREDHPKLAKMYMAKDIDPVPIDHQIQDMKRTEYLVKFCPRELPFMSVNLARRARALQTLHLSDDVTIPDTTNLSAFRHPAGEKYETHPKWMSFRPKYDDTLIKKLRKIQRVRTGDTTYQACHSLLGAVLQEKNPYGAPREEPKYGVWKNPYYYTYRIN